MNTEQDGYRRPVGCYNCVHALWFSSGHGITPVCWEGTDCRAPATYDRSDDGLRGRVVGPDFVCDKWKEAEQCRKRQ